MNKLPVLDLKDFTHGASAARTGFIQDLGDIFTDIGFVAVEHHGIAAELIDDFYAAVRKFFSLPEAQKASYEIAGLAGQRGYTSFGREKAKDATEADLKEFWQFGQFAEGDAAPGYPANIHVEEVRGFYPAGKALFRQFEATGGQLLRAIALYLGLPGDFFTPHIHLGNSILRAIHYPPIQEAPRQALRAESHEDINLITLLAGASADGLQVLDRSGHWMDARATKDQIIVNVGDMLQRLTNNRLRSTTHRVVNPPRELWHLPRFSIPFFLHPRPEMKLDCLKECTGPGRPAAYPPVTAGEYLHQRLVEIGLDSGPA